MKKTKYCQTARNYDGTAVTTHRVAELLSGALAEISGWHQDRPDFLLCSWPEIIGPRLAGMAQAVSFVEGVLTVRVKNSTLHSLLSRHDKYRLLAVIREKFPKIQITNILFKIA